MLRRTLATRCRCRSRTCFDGGGSTGGPPPCSAGRRNVRATAIGLLGAGTIRSSTTRSHSPPPHDEEHRIHEGEEQSPRLASRSVAIRQSGDYSVEGRRQAQELYIDVPERGCSRTYLRSQILCPLQDLPRERPPFAEGRATPERSVRHAPRLTVLESRYRACEISMYLG